MELNGYRLLLPEGTLEYFALVDVKESVNEVVIYLEEKNIVPEKYTDQDTESKGLRFEVNKWDPTTRHWWKLQPNTTSNTDTDLRIPAGRRK